MINLLEIYKGLTSLSEGKEIKKKHHVMLQHYLKKNFKLIDNGNKVSSPAIRMSYRYPNIKLPAYGFDDTWEFLARHNITEFLTSTCGYSMSDRKFYAWNFPDPRFSLRTATATSNKEIRHLSSLINQRKPLPKKKIDERFLTESTKKKGGHVMLQKWIDANFDRKKKYFTAGKKKLSLDEFVWKENKNISFSEYEKGLLKFFCRHGIDKFYKLSSSDCTASIGFSESEKKWYGWSQRAIFGFGIGQKIKKGDCAYVDHPYTCRTMEQCKKAAMNFAKDVS